MSRLNDWVQDWIADHMEATIVIFVLLLMLIVALPLIYEEMSRQLVASSLEEISRLIESGK